MYRKKSRFGHLPQSSNVPIVENNGVLGLVLNLVDNGLVKGELLGVSGLHCGPRQQAPFYFHQGIA